jgi:hypothetical protein
VVQAGMVQQLLGPLLHQLGPAVVEACDSTRQQKLPQKAGSDRTDVAAKCSSLVRSLVVAGELAGCAAAIDVSAVPSLCVSSQPSVVRC